MSNFTKKIDKQTSIKTKILEEQSLSYRAKGIYSYLVSRPENWKYNMQNLINTSTDGRESVQKGIKELEIIGLLKRTKAQNVEGKFVSWNWEIYDTHSIPISTDERENRQSVKPSNGKAVRINNYNEKQVYKRKKPVPVKIEEFNDKLVLTYNKYSTTMRSIRGAI